MTSFKPTETPAEGDGRRDETAQIYGREKMFELVTFFKGIRIYTDGEREELGTS